MKILKTHKTSSFEAMVCLSHKLNKTYLFDIVLYASTDLIVNVPKSVDLNPQPCTDETDFYTNLKNAPGFQEKLKCVKKGGS